MLKGARQFIKPLVLLIAIAAVLLFTDRKNRIGNQDNTPQTSDKSQTRIAFVAFSNSSSVDDTEKGIRDVIQELGLDEQVQLDVYNAQNDMTVVSSIVDNIKAKNYDIIMPVCTPTSQAVFNKIKDRPIVFSLVADPVFAGLGSSFEQHPDNISGISVMADFELTLQLVKDILPDSKQIGSLFNPAEANSVASKLQLEKAAKNVGLELIALPISNPGEISDATLSLLSKDIDAICQIANNLTASSYAGILNEVNKTSMPYFCFMAAQANDGAFLSVSRDYYQNGRDAMHLAKQVIEGVSLADIPFRLVGKTEVVLNESTAKRIDLSIPTFTLSKINRSVQ